MSNTTDTLTRTVAVQHPAMSEALLMDVHPDRGDGALAAHAAMFILREHDVMLDHAAFVVVDVPADTAPGLSLF